MVVKDMKQISKERVEEVFKSFSGKKIAVIGDVMLDRYFWGSVSRISPEAPVPVIDVDKESFHLGGAANVASNLRSLGMKTILCGVIGQDNSGEKFKNICSDNGIETSGLFEDESRPTTVKTRIIGNNQQMIRLDREIRDSINNIGEKFILKTLRNDGDLAGIIFGDYNKGAISDALIREVTKFAIDHNIPVFVDPKHDNFFDYQDVTVFKPNKKEAATALGMELKDDKSINEAGQKLIKELDCKYVLLTLGSLGMRLFDQEGNISSVDTKARQIADVSGAGDTVIATLAACMAGGAEVKEAATIANIAAGYVCGEPGIVSVTKENILEYP